MQRLVVKHAIQDNFERPWLRDVRNRLADSGQQSERQDLPMRPQQI
jgi:hypothetical protein